MIDRFVSDIAFEDQQYAVIIRSPVQSGKLRSITLSEAYTMPDGYRLYTARDIPGNPFIRIFENELPLFVQDTIEYTGQALGILMGPDRQVLQEILPHIRPDIEPIPPEEFEPEQLQFFDYPIIAKEQRGFGSTETIFETAPAIVYSSLTTEAQYPARSEQFTVIVQPEENRCNIYVPTQWPMHVRQAAAAALCVPEEYIIVHPTQTGAVCNDLLWYPSLLSCQCAVAAYCSGRTVKLSLTTKESITAVPKTPEVIIQHKSALHADNSIAAMQIFIIVKSGAFCPLIQNILKQMLAAALDPYDIPCYKIEAVGLKTPQGLTDIFEGWGESFTSNALEAHISKIVQEKNLSPDEWRVQHIREPYRDAFQVLMNAAAAKSDFLRKYTAHRLFNLNKKDKYDGKWRGIGLSAGFQYSGCPVGFTYTAELMLAVDGKAYVKAEPAEPALKDVLTTLIATGLDIPEQDIVFTGLTTADMNDSGPATAAHTVSILPALIEQCIADIQEQRFRNPLPLCVSRSYTVPQPEPPLAEGASAVSFISKTPAVCVIELELDPVCYESKILGIWLVCSPGKIYKKPQVISYLHTNIMLALSRTFKEALRYADMSNTPFLPYEYRIISPNEVPPATVEMIETDTVMSALDGLASNLVPAAYLAALNQMLVRSAVQIEKIPVLPEDIFRALKRPSDNKGIV